MRTVWRKSRYLATSTSLVDIYPNSWLDKVTFTLLYTLNLESHSVMCRIPSGIHIDFLAVLCVAKDEVGGLLKRVKLILLLNRAVILSLHKNL